MGTKITVPCILGSALALTVIGAACGSPIGPPPVGSAVKYRLTGSVLDAASAAPIAGALVEARNGPDQTAPPTTIATTGSNGGYILNGVSSVSYVRVMKWGYFDVTERIELTADGTRNFSIARDASIPDLNGAY